MAVPQRGANSVRGARGAPVHLVTIQQAAAIIGQHWPQNADDDAVEVLRACGCHHAACCCGP